MMSSRLLQAAGLSLPWHVARANARSVSARAGGMTRLERLADARTSGLGNRCVSPGVEVLIGLPNVRTSRAMTALLSTNVSC